MITSAAEYHAAFVAAAADGTLVQDNRFTAEAGGTELCPMLAILGEGVASAADCPATVMPQWLAQLVPALFNLQPLDQALEWGSECTAQLARLDGNVSFSVAHTWMAQIVLPLSIDAGDAFEMRTWRQKGLQILHLRAAAGIEVTPGKWQEYVGKVYAARLRDADGYAFESSDGAAGNHIALYADVIADAYEHSRDCAPGEAWKLMATGLVSVLEGT